MARIGSFSQPTVVFGEAVNVVKPPDNQFPLFDPELMADKTLTDKQRNDLQQQIDELAAALTLARDFKP